MAGQYKTFMKFTVNILFYDKLKHFFKADEEESVVSAYFYRFLSGLIGGFTTVLFSYPLETIQTWLQSDVTHKNMTWISKTTFDGFSHILN